jgi:hypothetical protein
MLIPVVIGKDQFRATQWATTLTAAIRRQHSEHVHFRNFLKAFPERLRLDEMAAWRGCVEFRGPAARVGVS